jgi:DNA-binding NtrC family response regulator
VHSILIVEDDPLHLKLYTWIIQRGGYAPLPMLADADGVRLPSEKFAVAVLDYRLGKNLAAPAIASDIKKAAPDSPIVVLSDMMWMPEDMLPYTKIFVRKGEPEQLLHTLARLVPKTD